MTLIADILMIAGALGAAFYCVILSRRLSRLTNMEDGMGGAITVLSTQVGEMTQTLDRAQTAARASSTNLDEATARAEAAARRLELLIASMHDLPEAKPAEAPEPARGATFLHRRRAAPRTEAAE